MIERELVNVTTLAIYRPVRSGAGQGSAKADDAVVYSGLLAIHEPAQSSAQTDTERSHTQTDTLFIDPVDDDGDPIEVWPDDLVDWTDRTGRKVTRRRVRRVQPWSCGAEIDHLELEI